MTRESKKASEITLRNYLNFRFKEYGKAGVNLGYFKKVFSNGSVIYSTRHYDDQSGQENLVSARAYAAVREKEFFIQEHVPENP